MKNTSTGAPAIKFEYFDQFNDMFGKKPNITPIAIASSSKGNERKDSTEIEESTNAIPIFGDDKTKGKCQPKLKKRKTKADRFLEHMESMSEKREDSKKPRHDEMIAMQRKTTKIFAQKMDKLINKL
ncbi:unnamed protein product [Brassicogethes aeneus]|uniref:Uncharacterized protein n=1 Tax=Brassicogethes aeneus TaxID=1431903 RepID=A0A9P0FMB2_BRAAE|nr:unnamed protein product [Brassicogethes aeneus]